MSRNRTALFTSIIMDVHVSTESRTWGTNVLRGYSMGQTTHEVVASGQAVIRLYLLDPGLVVNRLEIL